MLNEWQEFLEYTGAVTYTAAGKNDTTYLGRFTFDTLLDFERLARVLTILARGYLFHGTDGSILQGGPRSRIDYARRALCAWCSVPDKKTATPKETWQFRTDFRNLHQEFPDLVGEDGVGWFCRHVHSVAGVIRENLEKVRKTALDKAVVIEKKFDTAWRNKVLQFQAAIFSPQTKGAWTLRFDDVIADALELGPLRQGGPELPPVLLEKLRVAVPSGIPFEIVQTLVAYYIANKPEDSDWVVLPVANFDAYFGGTSFSKKHLKAIPETIIVRDGMGFGVCRYKIKDELIALLRSNDNQSGA